jgi:pimeloyl-ACP methyl ester carboxylesterase
MSDPGLPKASIHNGKKQLAVFVHGFGSSPACWRPLLEAFKADSTINALFDFECYQYSTKWLTLSVLKRIPRIEEISRGLAQFLENSRFSGYDDVTLLGHSQGGLVIQSYLADKLKPPRPRGEDLARIRQVILLATPNQGSTIVSGLRSAIFTFFKNPQETGLRVLNPEVRDMLAIVDECIVNAKTRENICWPVPIYCFWGEDDAVVPEASARGFHTDAGPLPGDHFTILRPKTREHYLAIGDVLREPVGHKNFFELELYQTSIRVEPLSDDHSREVPSSAHPNKKRIVHSNHVARVNRTVVFSRRNCCRDLFTIKYRTRTDGYVSAVTSHPNQATADEMGRHSDYGNEFFFRFIPKAGETYHADFEVLKGFDEGHRDLHFHLGRQTHYRCYKMKVDLTGYLAEGYEIKDKPKLYFFGQDPGSCDLCKHRELKDPLPYSHVDPAGIWEWEMRDVREGVLDVVWDVEKRKALSAKAS